MELSKNTHFRNRFHTVVGDIAKGLSTSRASATDVHWYKWDVFCRDVALNYLLIFYRYPIPVINAFTQKYRTESISSSRRQS